MSVVLIGMMGVGKTTLGRAASKALGWKFIDVDRQIELAEGRRITEIFEADGEPAFREMETLALAELSGRKHAVVSTGGGAPIQRGNLELMREIGPIVYLQAGVEALTRRLKNSRTRRPLLGNDIERRIRTLLQERQQFYRQADFKIDVDGHSPMETVLEIKRIAESMS